ncbi:MAG: hypothetical protein HY677_04700 [Chloroflexi bacterium]|nr:hypothetical protein [Chloroflexota bacterium]
MTYLVFFHIMAVLWFIAGVVAVNVLMMRASHSKDVAFIRLTLDYAVFFGTFFSLQGAISPEQREPSWRGARAMAYWGRVGYWRPGPYSPGALWSR